MRKLIIGLILSAIALWWAFKEFDWAAFTSAMTGASIVYLVLSLFALLLAIPIRGFRWRIFLEPMGEVTNMQTTEATVVGYFGNNIFPFRFGEVIRSYFISRQCNIPLSKVFGSILVERLIDVGSMLLILALLPLIVAIPEDLKIPVIVTMAISLGAIILLIWASSHEKISIASGKLKNMIENLHTGFSSFRQSRHHPSIILATILIWTCYYLNIYWAQQALGIGFSLGQSYLLLVIVSVVIAIPAAPGYLGTYHAAVIFLVNGLLDVEMAPAQALAIILHAMGYVFYSILGSIGFFRSHMKIRDIQAERATLEQEAVE